MKVADLEKMKKLTKNIVILGAGGHAMVLLDCLMMNKRKILGFLEKNSLNKSDSAAKRPPILGSDDHLKKLSPQKVELVNGVGSVKSLEKRRDIFRACKDLKFKFATVIHPKSIVSKTAKIGEGVQILAGAIVQPNSQIGMNSIINTGAIVEHDCSVGDHVHIASGAILSGGVSVGSESHIGAGATIKQGITIGNRCVIGAGAVVIKNVSNGETVVGVPAEPVKSKRN
jgi:sugar O-acyltransferase (sialic acid O-acetyltransferase NeuD family)